MNLLPIGASILALIAVINAENCEVLTLKLNATGLLEYKGIKVVGSTTHASCGLSCDQPNGKMKLQLSDIDPIVNKMTMLIFSTKEAVFHQGKRYMKVTKVGNDMLLWPPEGVKMAVHSGGPMEDEIHFMRQYKGGKKFDPRQTMEEKRDNMFTFAMKRKHMRSIPQPLVSMEGEFGYAYVLYAFARKYVIDSNVQVSARVKCETSYKNIDVDVLLDGVQHGRVMTSSHQKQLMSDDESKLDCVWKAEYFQNVESTKESGEKFIRKKNRCSWIKQSCMDKYLALND